MNLLRNIALFISTLVMLFILFILLHFVGLISILPIPTILVATPQPLVEVTVAPSPTIMLTDEAPLEPLFIGIAIDRLGKNFRIGEELEKAVSVAQDFFRQTRVGGRTIQLILQDTGGEGMTPQSAYEMLIFNTNVIAIVGPTTSFDAFAANPVAEQNGVPVVGSNNTALCHPDNPPTCIFKEGKYISRISATVDQFAPFSVRSASSFQKVVIVYQQDDPFSNDEAAIFLSTVKSSPYNIRASSVFTQTFKGGDAEFTTQLEFIRDKNPDLIIVSGLSKTGIPFIQQLRKEYQDEIIVGNGFNILSILPDCLMACDDLLIAQSYDVSSTYPTNLQFIEVYQKKYDNEKPTQPVAQTFAAIQVIIQALEALNKDTSIRDMELKDLRDKLNEQLLSGMKFQTPLGLISLTDDGELIPGENQFTAARIQMGADGKWEFAPVQRR